MILKSSSIFLYFLFNTLVSFCQTKFDALWTDGQQAFYDHAVKGKIIQFEGGNLHEGGSNFYCEILSDTKIKILGGMPEDNETSPGYGELNSTLEYKTINSFEVLILKDTNNIFKGLLRKVPPSLNLEEFIVTNKINYQLAGKYVIAGTKDTVMFFLDEKRMSWLGKSKNYEFETEYDFPIDVITIGAESYAYERKFKTLFLYEAKKTGDDDFQKGKLLYKLSLIGNLRQYPFGLNGDYAFASIFPLTGDILEFYSLRELNLIRNEIFARHGYVFTNPEVKKYFESEAWYKPILHDVSDKFSEIERLNIEQIKLVEAVRKMMLNK